MASRHVRVRDTAKSTIPFNPEYMRESVCVLEFTCLLIWKQRLQQRSAAISSLCVCVCVCLGDIALTLFVCVCVCVSSCQRVCSYFERAHTHPPRLSHYINVSKSEVCTRMCFSIHSQPASVCVCVLCLCYLRDRFYGSHRSHAASPCRCALPPPPALSSIGICKSADHTPTDAL